jgi:septal ring factor EnvC (AmiA/AmiB activator)
MQGLRPVNAALAQALITAVLVLAGVAVTQWQLDRASKRTTRIEEEKVDAAAYDRARNFDREVVEGIREELDRAKRELAEMRAALARERAEWSTERAELLRHIAELERSVARLRRRLRAAGIDIEEEPA